MLSRKNVKKTMPEVKRKEKSGWMTEETLEMVRDGQEAKAEGDGASQNPDCSFAVIAVETEKERCRERTRGGRREKQTEKRDLHRKTPEMKGKFKLRLGTLNKMEACYQNRRK